MVPVYMCMYIVLSAASAQMLNCAGKATQLLLCQLARSVVQ